MNRDEVFEGVRECVAEVLDIGTDVIKEDSRLIDDLGAESLDLLDLSFQLEQKFSISISPRGMEKRAQEALGDTPLEIDGGYTPEALAELRKAMPEASADDLAEGLTVAELPRRFRVATMVNVVCRLLEEKGE